jgi:hypothetical protein
MLSVKSHPFDQYVEQLKQDFDINTAEQLKELVLTALAQSETQKIREKMQEGLLGLNSLYMSLRNILLDTKTAEACRKGVILIKKGILGENLYLGDVLDSKNKRNLCFFESTEKDKDKQEMHYCGISMNSF